MENAINNFANLNVDNKILIIGDMLELGSYSIDEHMNILNLIKQNNFDKVILVGKDFSAVNNNYISFLTSVEAKAWLIDNPISNSTILVKGSRGIKLEVILDAI